MKHDLVCVGDEVHTSIDHLVTSQLHLHALVLCHGFMLAVIKVHADSSSSVVADTYILVLLTPVSQRLLSL